MYNQAGVRMSRITDTDCSSEILKGMLRRGNREEEIAAVIAVSVARVKAVLNDRARLTFRQRMAIERATGLTTGQLAAAAIEPRGGPLTELMNLWAAAVPPE